MFCFTAEVMLVCEAPACNYTGYGVYVMFQSMNICYPKNFSCRKLLNEHM